MREDIKHSGTVIIVAMRNNGKVVRQYRYGQHSVSLELPAGRIDPGEKPLNAAKRELREETGHVAAKWTPLLLIHPCRYCQVNNGSDKNIPPVFDFRIDFFSESPPNERIPQNFVAVIPFLCGHKRNNGFNLTIPSWHTLLMTRRKAAQTLHR